MCRLGNVSNEQCEYEKTFRANHCVSPIQNSENVTAFGPNSLWSQSAGALANSEKIVIIGYSFPPTDTRALELLGDALAARPGAIAVEIVAPDASAIVSRIGETRLANANSVTAHNMKFEDYLGLLAENVPALMRKAAAEHEAVHEWATRIYAMGQLTVARQEPFEAAGHSRYELAN